MFSGIISLNPDNQPIDLYVHGYINLPVYYYQYRLNLHWLTIYSNWIHSWQTINLTAEDCDYYLLEFLDENLVSEENLTIYKYYPLSDLYLCINS